MPVKGLFISKSKFLAGLQCGKLLWHYYNAKDKFPPVDASTQAVFDQGHEVGQLAKRLFPNGIEVAEGTYRGFGKIERESWEALRCRRPAFEPGFRFGNAFARADILDPVGKNAWDIVEVKSSTEVKDVNIYDMALQRYVYEGAGIDIHKCYILHVNNEYVRRGPIDPKELFCRVDVTDRVSAFLPEVEEELKQMIRTIGSKSCPEVPIGPHCKDPYECPLMERCWEFLPDDNIFTLYRMGSKGFDLLKKGVESIGDLPRGYKLTDNQQIQVKCLRTGKPHCDSNELRAFLDGLEYPLFFLDFETVNTAIPLFDLLSPYEHLPFQYSLEIIQSVGDEARHHGFLSDGSRDPRPEILQRLKRLLGKCGSIIAYNASFEKSALRSATSAVDGYDDWYASVEPRIVDLLAPFRSFHYYHPAQRGSASIKAVYPALTGRGYGGLAIVEGSLASLEYLRVTFGEVTAAERAKVRRQLEEYCATDTRAMAGIVEAIRKLSGNAVAHPLR